MSLPFLGYYGLLKGPGKKVPLITLEGPMLCLNLVFTDMK